MRPEVLELEGFTAFREPTRVEFGDAELFALTGPTGAGKSSIIDAMIFALYGSVPRLGEKAVEPVISKGRLEARIRLDFSLDEKRYTAVRVVSRTPSGGAATKEARLECGEAVLADGAKDLNEKVRELVGLDFGQFTTCVALPQGEFAKFLKQPAAERQALLSQLLGLNIYELVRRKANDERTAANARLVVLNSQLDALADVTQAKVDERKTWLADLKTLQKLATRRLPKLSKLQSDLDAAQKQHSVLKAQIEALEAIRTPDAVKMLAKATKVAEECDDQARQALHQADQQVTEASELLDSLGDKMVLGNLHTRYLDKEKRTADLKKAERSAADAAKIAAKHRKALREAESALSAAQATLDAEKRNHAAHALQEHLVLGEPCPVCQQSVNISPSADELADLRKLESALTHQRHQMDGVQGLHMDATKRHAAVDELWKTKQSEFKELEASLRNQPPLPEVKERIAAIELASRELETSEQHLIKARRAADTTAQALKEAQERETNEWDEYLSQLLGLAKLSLSPPKPGTALIDAWQDLEAWAQDQASKLREELAALAKQASKLERKGKALQDTLAKAFAEHDLPFDGDAKTHVATAVHAAQTARDDMRNKLAEKRKCKQQAKAAQSEADVAKALAQHLTAPQFPRWLLAAAFDRLVSGASATLRELSGGQYTFHSNAKFEFDVVDHANAGETRSAKTLSGGETFLASLALALTLAEHVSDLAAAGTAKLESIFLDEGFGSLDGETLDTVATAIEELSTQGRTVGIVTHVADLAERVPVRFKVSKTAATAVVERVAL